MNVIQTVQGTDHWEDLRFEHDCASEAAAMMDQSKHMKRAELVRMKALGQKKEFSDWVQEHILDKGHEAEAGARPIACSYLSEELYPVTVVSEDGKRLASLDGITMDDSTIWENKQWNAELAAMVKAGELGPHWYWQLEHQLEVTGAEKVFFTCSDGTPENFEAMEYFPVPGRREALLAGWVQFRKDVAEYQHVEVPAKARGESKQAESLPLVEVNVSGQLAVISNLETFGAKMTAWIRKLDMKPSTDQAFADTDLAIKELEKAEVALLTAKDRALKQTTGIDEVCRLVDSYHGTARTTRLLLQRLLADRKTAIRAEIIQEGKDALTKHIAELNDGLGKNYMPAIASDFAKAISGKKTVQSLRDAMTTHLSFTKMAASGVATAIQKNLNLLREAPAKDYPDLFADEKTIVLKAADDLAALVTNRINAHKEAEAKRKKDAEDKRLADEADAQRKAQAATPAPTAAPVTHIGSRGPSGTTILAGSPSDATGPVGVGRFGGGRYGGSPAAAPNDSAERADLINRITPEGLHNLTIVQLRAIVDEIESVVEVR